MWEALAAAPFLARALVGSSALLAVGMAVLSLSYLATMGRHRAWGLQAWAIGQAAACAIGAAGMGALSLALVFAL